MCDYSLQNVKTRDAKVEDRLVTTNFGTGTRGFACVDDPACAVCVKPGTEIAFEAPVQVYATLSSGNTGSAGQHSTCIFRQVHKEHERMHHDALEFPDGSSVLLTSLQVGQKARVLQLPAPPQTPKEVEEQKRVAWAG